MTLPFRRPTSLRCRQVHRVIDAFLDGELGPEHAELVADHLEDCEACGVEAETIEQVRDAVSRLREAEDPEALGRLRGYLDQLVVHGPE